MSSRTDEGAAVDIYEADGGIRHAVVGKYQTATLGYGPADDLDSGSPECVTWLAVGPDPASAVAAARKAGADELVQGEEEEPSECCTFTSSNVTLVESGPDGVKLNSGYRLIMLDGEFSDTAATPMYTARHLVAVSEKLWSDAHPLKPLWDFQTRLARHLFRYTKGAGQ